MANDIKELKRLCREEELDVIEYPDGRVFVVGGIVNVHWWPSSKHRTAYAEGAPRGHKFSKPKNVINLATKGVWQ